MSARRGVGRTIYIAGEPELVGEFGRLCAAAGLGVVCPPPARGAAPLPAGFRAARAIPASSIAAVELTNTDPERKKTNLAKLDAGLPPRLPLLSSAVTITAGEQASWIRRPSRLVGFGAFPTLLGGPLVEVSVTLRTEAAPLGLARDFFGQIGKELTVVQDRPGMVMPRILCMLINEACFALTEGIASPGDIDTAMKLGTNHPRGPVEWANLVGIRQVAAVLNGIREATGEERYRLAPVLQQMSIEPGAWKS